MINTTEEFKWLLRSYRHHIRSWVLNPEYNTAQAVNEDYKQLVEAFDQMRMAAEDDRGVL